MIKSKIMLQNIKRLLNFDRILKRKSLFLLGPRQTGKTTHLKSSYPEALYIDLLDLDMQRDLNLKPSLLKEMIEAKKIKNSLVIIDEIQKMPELLNEVHRLIEADKTIRFILTGSSARKIKKTNSNLLGGRAASVSMHPLSLFELQNTGYLLSHYYQFGGIPSVVTSDNPKKDLKDYIELYLTQEIQMEGLVRNLANFGRFLYFAATTNCEQINYTGLGNDAQIPSRTVQDYYQILEDTLIGYRLSPFVATKRKPVSIDKFYFFDIGVANYLKNKIITIEGPDLFGKIFEHAVFCELKAYLSCYPDKDYEINYWRTQTKLEVDFILNNGKKIIAIEVKASKQPSLKKLNGLKAFKDEYPKAMAIVVCQAKFDSIQDGITMMSMEGLVQKLWSHQLL